ncbi:MAG: hypothetical protein JNJ99_09805, partial [Crocinitomicaceae bacterium]|nr:hypothetical protein [Crocinitomicaceae bacterium]
MKIILGFLLSVFLISCSGVSDEIKEQENDSIITEVIDTVPPFESIQSNFTTDSLILPAGFTYTILFQEEFDLVTRADGKQFPAKGYHDMSVFIPDAISPETKGKLYISHES